jgi:hypothetical protein
VLGFFERDLGGERTKGGEERGKVAEGFAEEICRVFVSSVDGLFVRSTGSLKRFDVCSRGSGRRGGCWIGVLCEEGALEEVDVVPLRLFDEGIRECGLRWLASMEGAREREES